MTKQIETIMALADSFAEYHDHSEYVHARARLRQALEAALKPGEAQCKWPTCQTEEYQHKLADDVAGELIGTPRREPLTDEQVGQLTVFEGLHHVEVPLLAQFIRHIEAVVRGKP
jgi:hypothetical protein